MKVIVEPYDTAWANQFEQIKAQVEEAMLGVTYIRVEHVGSTSVPGLAAKPVIDLSVISEREDVDAAIAALTTKGGYTYWGTWGIPDRHAFRKSGVLPERHLYVSVKDCQSIRNQLALRDVCRREQEVRDAYGRKKLELAKQDWGKLVDYCEAKNDIIAGVLEKAGMSAEEREQIKALNTIVR